MQKKIKKKVFHIITRYDLGGAERVALNICTSKTANIEYHMVEVVRGCSVPFTKQFIEEMKENEVVFHRSLIPQIHFHYLFERIAALLFPLRFAFLVLRYHPVAVHTHTEVPDMAYRAFSFFFPFLSKRHRLVRTIHNNILWTGLQRTGRFVEKMYIKRCSNVAISPAVATSYGRIYGQIPPVIYNGVPLSPQKEHRFSLRTDKINVLFAGRFEEQKGVDILLKVVNLLQNENFHFHIFGSGRLQKDVENGVSECKNATLSAPIYGLSSLLSSFDYVFMPSRFEGLSMLSIEACMASVPVIASRCAGLTDTLPADWPLLAEIGDVKGFVNIFKNILPNIDREQLSQRARNFSQEKFGVNSMIKAYEKLYLFDEK